jgi:hypothetical protein
MKQGYAHLPQLLPTRTSLAQSLSTLFILRKTPNPRQRLWQFASAHELGYSSGKAHLQQKERKGEEKAYEASRRFHRHR